MNKEMTFLFFSKDVLVDSFNEKTKTATMVYNFNFQSDFNVNKIIQYTTGFLFCLKENLPKDSNVIMVFDMRYQNVERENVESIKLYLESTSSIPVQIQFNF